MSLHMTSAYWTERMFRDGARAAMMAQERSRVAADTIRSAAAKLGVPQPKTAAQRTDDFRNLFVKFNV